MLLIPPPFFFLTLLHSFSIVLGWRQIGAQVEWIAISFGLGKEFAAFETFPLPTFINGQFGPIWKLLLHYYLYLSTSYVNHLCSFCIISFAWLWDSRLYGNSICDGWLYTGMDMGFPCFFYFSLSLSHARPILSVIFLSTRNGSIWVATRGWYLGGNALGIDGAIWWKGAGQKPLIMHPDSKRWFDFFFVLFFA